MKSTIIALTLLLALSASADRPKANYKITRLSIEQVGISCLSGGDPTGNKIGDMVIMSCK